MIGPQCGYTCISSLKLELILQPMSYTLNILHEIVCNFLDNLVYEFRINETVGDLTFIEIYLYDICWDAITDE